MAAQALLEAEALAGHDQDVAPEREAIQERRRHPLVAQQLVPAGEFEVRGHQDAPAIVALSEELEEELRPVRAEGQVAELVNNNKIERPELLEELVEAILLLGGGQLVDER